MEIEGNVARLHVHRSHILASKSAGCPRLSADIKILNMGAWSIDQRPKWLVRTVGIMVAIVITMATNITCSP